MSIENIKRMKCDNCGIIKDVKDHYYHPPTWIVVDVVKWSGASGRSVFKRDACSEKCAKEMMHAVKRFSTTKPRYRI